MMLITKRLSIIEKQQSSVNEELQGYLDNKTDYVVSTLSKYLKSSVVVEKFTSWTLDDVPNTEGNWWVTRPFTLQNAIRKRLQDVIASWEEENHVFSEARSSLIHYFQERFRFVEEQLKNLERSVVDKEAASPSSSLLDPDTLKVAAGIIISVACPIWIPLCRRVWMVSIPTMISAAVVNEMYEIWSKTREYEKKQKRIHGKSFKRIFN